MLSYDVRSGSEMTLCNKVDKPAVVYRFSGNVMTSIHVTTLRTSRQNYNILRQKQDFKVNLFAKVETKQY